MSENTNGAKPAPILLTPEEAAKLLNISRSRIYELIRRGELLSVKIGKVRRISVRQLEAFVERQERAAEEATR